MMSYLLQFALSLFVVQVVLADDAAEAKNLTLNRLCSTGTCDTCAPTESYQLGCVEIPERKISDFRRVYRNVLCNDSSWSVQYYSDEDCTKKVGNHLFTWEDMTSTALGCTELSRGVWIYTTGQSVLVYLCPLSSERYVCDGKDENDRRACKYFKIKKPEEGTCVKSSLGDLYYTNTFNGDTSITLSIYRTKEECTSNGPKMVFFDNQPLSPKEQCLVKTETITAVCPTAETTTETTTTTEATSNESNETTSTTAETTTGNSTSETTTGTPTTDPSSINGTGDNDTDDNTTGGSAGVVPICATCLLALFVVLGLMN